MSTPSSPVTEPLADELGRLVKAYTVGERQNRAEAWNLIAECVVERWEELSGALRRAETSGSKRPECGRA